MSRYSSDTVDVTPERSRSDDPAHDAPSREAAPVDHLESWLRGRAGHLERSWSDEVRLRNTVRESDFAGAVDRFVRELVHMLPLTLGARRQEVAPVWERACQLFGTVAARRGLASGEVIEEFHILRELVIQDLFRDPPTRAGALSLAEVLRLNRAFDRGVTHASIGHTDALFFDLLDPQGSAAQPSFAELAEEVSNQLDQIVTELREIFSSPVTFDGEAAREH